MLLYSHATTAIYLNEEREKLPKTFFLPRSHFNNVKSPITSNKNVSLLFSYQLLNENK